MSEPGGQSLPSLAPSGSSFPLSVDPPAPNLPFTDAQVDEFREQDRWLPVSKAGCPFAHLPFSSESLTYLHVPDSVLTLHVADRQRLEDHEELVTYECKGVERSQGMRAGMRLRIHLLHCALARISSLHLYAPKSSIPTGIAYILHFGGNE
jgi:hypothetical protein